MHHVNAEITDFLLWAMNKLLYKWFPLMFKINILQVSAFHFPYTIKLTLKYKIVLFIFIYN